MDIKKSDVADMQRLYKEHFNIDLDYDTAYRKLTLLVRQMELIYQPITEEQVSQLKASVLAEKNNQKHVAGSEKQ